uniref:Uncharacterized protein n=1 Tax=Tanacetum cinerariifolium TaxID=118510 RepID=A0A6L2NJ42_TANCI|nr:hypothetical protein [Tanacetum cinerariifolium]
MHQLDHYLSGILEQLDQYLVGKIRIVNELMEHISLEEWMMTDCKHCGELMIENHLMDRLLKEVLMIEHVIHTVKTDMVIYTEKTEMIRLVVEIECASKIADTFDKATSDGNDKVIMWYQEARFGLEFCLVDFGNRSSNKQWEPILQQIVGTNLATNSGSRSKSNSRNRSISLSIEADDQAIQTILLGLPEDIYAAVDSCEIAQEIWLRVQQMMKCSNIGIQEKNANQTGVDVLPLFIRPRICIQLITLNSPHQDQSSFNQNYLQQPMPNPKDITDPITSINMALALMAKAFKLNYSTPTKNNQRISLNPRNRQITQPGMNMSQDRQMQMVGGNGGNQFRQYAGQNAGNPAGYNDVIGNQVMQNAVQNPKVQNVGNHNGLIGVQRNGNHNQIGNGNLVAAHAGGNAAGQNGNQIRCYNCGGVEEDDLMAAAADLDEIEEVNANCILMANLQQTSTSGTQTDSAPVYDTDG